MKCPYCGGDHYNKTDEIEYENENDQTPMYGGVLCEVEIESCQDCNCVSKSNADNDRLSTAGEKDKNER